MSNLIESLIEDYGKCLVVMVGVFLVWCVCAWIYGPLADWFVIAFTISGIIRLFS